MEVSFGNVQGNWYVACLDIVVSSLGRFFFFLCHFFFLFLVKCTGVSSCRIHWHMWCHLTRGTFLFHFFFPFFPLSFSFLYLFLSQIVKIPRITHVLFDVSGVPWQMWWPTIFLEIRGVPGYIRRPWYLWYPLKHVASRDVCDVPQPWGDDRGRFKGPSESSLNKLFMPAEITLRNCPDFIDKRNDLSNSSTTLPDGKGWRPRSLMGWSGYRYANQREYIHTYNEIHKQMGKRKIDKRKYILALKENTIMRKCIRAYK